MSMMLELSSRMIDYLPDEVAKIQRTVELALSESKSEEEMFSLIDKQLHTNHLREGAREFWDVFSNASDYAEPLTEGVGGFPVDKTNIQKNRQKDRNIGRVMDVNGVQVLVINKRSSGEYVVVGKDGKRMVKKGDALGVTRTEKVEVNVLDTIDEEDQDPTKKKPVGKTSVLINPKANDLMKEGVKKDKKTRTKAPRWQDSDGDGNWYEPGQDVKKEEVEQIDEISADLALAASKAADVKRGKLAVAGNREGAAAKAAQAQRLYDKQAERRKKETQAAVQEGLDMKTFKANRAKNERKAATKDARDRGHEGHEWHNTGRTYSPDEAKSRRTNMSDDERAARHRAAVDPDDDRDENTYSADRTRNPRKQRKQAAMGEMMTFSNFSENRAAMRDPERYERSREARAGRAARSGINDPHTGINSPAFAEFMRQQMGGSKPKPKPKSDLKNSYEPEGEELDEGEVPLKTRNKGEMQRKAGNLGREVVSTPNTRANAPKRDAAMNRMKKLVSAIARDDERKRFETIGQSPLHNSYDTPLTTTEETEMEIGEGLAQARKNVGASKCWPGKVAKGTKMKNGREVPNCVDEAYAEYEDIILELIKEGYTDDQVFEILEAVEDGYEVIFEENGYYIVDQEALDEQAFYEDVEKVANWLEEEGLITTEDEFFEVMDELTEEEIDKLYDIVMEATAMAKRGHDETAIRNKIASSTQGGAAADRAKALADKQTYGQRGVDPKARQNLARKQMGDHRQTTSSNPGLHGYGHKSDDPKVRDLQTARGAQRGSATLTPNERKKLNAGYEMIGNSLEEGGMEVRTYSWREVMEQQGKYPTKRGNKNGCA